MPSQDNLHARVADFEAMEADLKATRQHLHANPELSFEEAETARYVAERLQVWGYAVTRNVGAHGVVATLRNGTGTKSIGIRADMDALPIEEETGVACSSTVPVKPPTSFQTPQKSQ
jgi:hippurate hydrolase